VLSPISLDLHQTPCVGVLECSWCISNYFRVFAVFCSASSSLHMLCTNAVCGCAGVQLVHFQLF
jgi:hypothetical protein